jgi:hypothetical protein
MGTVLMRPPETVLLNSLHTLVEGQQASPGRHRHLGVEPALTAPAVARAQERDCVILILAVEVEDASMDEMDKRCGVLLRI